MSAAAQKLGARALAVCQRFSASKFSTGLRMAILAAIGLYLVHKITRIGVLSVLDSLPANPAFYVISMLIYLALPVSEILIYRRLWGRPLLRFLPFFLRKQVYNAAVVGYAGEMVFCFWAHDKLGLARQRALVSIKDNNILSAMASNLVTLVLVAAFFLTGKIGRLGLGGHHGMAMLVAAIGTSLVIIVLVIVFRRTILALPLRLAGFVFTVHVSRVVLVAALQALQWALVIPQAPVSVWITFLAAQFVLTRIPFLPNKDLAFLGLSLGLAALVQAPGAVVAGMFIASGALTQIANLAVFALTSLGVISAASDTPEAAAISEGAA